MPFALAEVVSGFTPERMQQLGMYWLGQQRTSSEMEGVRIVVHALQAVTATAIYVKWIAVLAGDEMTYLVTGTIPREAKSEQIEELREIIHSVRLDQNEERALGATAPIQVQPLGGLQQAFSPGDILMFTQDGVYAAASDAPYFIVGWAATEIQPQDLPDFARVRARQTPGQEAIEILEEDGTDIAGFPAYRISATEENGSARFWQAVILYKDLYLLFQGHASLDAWGYWEPLFQSMVTQTTLQAKSDFEA